ncbi:MAG TPA: sugar ABC transporter ATP-binding protein [Solirubrobacterales bacterium]|jgi:simple sugar transport system ATP-binding protein/ribose transport system ATP-binding protein|nr:sugar ABC transporter ATP-binding protein [Solirubrobacterales bacterium]
MSGGNPQIELRGIGKRFSGVYVLRDIDLDIRAGTIHALVGENGAGKSTLGKAIAGVHRPDAGVMRFKGREVQFKAPRAAIEMGITMIAQEQTLVPRRTVIENVFLGTEVRSAGVVRTSALRARYAELSERLGFDIPAGAIAGTLSVADQQKVEILRALARKAEVVVMDEPTAALNSTESELLFKAVKDLRDAGTTMIYISHFLEEVLELSDDITVLKDGRLIKTVPAATETPESIITAMLGRKMDGAFPPKRPPGPSAEVVLEVEGLSTPIVSDVSLTVRRGEIVALTGLVGSGRSEVVRAIFGADRRTAGSIRIKGSPVEINRVPDAIAAGIGLIPESRKTDGLLLRRSIAENISLPHLRGTLSRAGVISRRREAQEVTAEAKTVDIRFSDLGEKVEHLSGGNQQKVMFAKWLLREPTLFLIDEPTRGVDVGAKEAIYALIGELAEKGMAVLMVSSEVEEVIGLAHRVLVMRTGSITAELDGDTVSESDLMEAAFGMATLVEEKR